MVQYVEPSYPQHYFGEISKSELITQVKPGSQYDGRLPFRYVSYDTVNFVNL